MVSGMANGRAAMLSVKKTIRRLHPLSSLKDFCMMATMDIMKIYRECGYTPNDLTKHPEWRLTASVAVLSITRREIWLIGDCQCIVGGKHYDNPKPEEEGIAQHRSEIITRMLSTGEATIEDLLEHDSARDVIVGDIAKTCGRQNIDFSVVDGFPIAIDKVKVVPLGGCREVVLATDGYPLLYPTLQESEEALAHLLKEDPLCYRSFKATKGLRRGQSSFDDRAYVRVEIEA